MPIRSNGRDTILPVWVRRKLVPSTERLNALRQHGHGAIKLHGRGLTLLELWKGRMKTGTWFEVLCPVHGTQEAAIKAYPHKSVTVGKPKNKRDRKDGGCPKCKKEVPHV